MNDIQFPILFENTKVKVFNNPSGEIFVLLKINNIQIRISDHRDFLIVTAGNGNGRLEPSLVGGLPAFRILPERL